MIVLTCPFQWGGRLLPAGKRISLPAGLEERLLQAGSASRPEAASPAPEAGSGESAAPAQADGGAADEAGEQGEKKKSKKAQQAFEPPAELGLGR